MKSFGRAMLDIILVNWNSGRQLLDAVVSIINHHAGVVGKVIVVDNNSTDGSLDVLKQQLPNVPFCVQFVENSFNKGFGAACNQGVPSSPTTRALGFPIRVPAPAASRIPSTRMTPG